MHDPFTGAEVQISNRLVDRLRGKYASGPHLPNGNPEFGWRQFQAPPIQHEAAARIEALEAALRVARANIVETMEEMGYSEKEIADLEAEDETLNVIDAALRNSPTNT